MRQYLVLLVLSLFVSCHAFFDRIGELDGGGAGGCGDHAAAPEEAAPEIPVNAIYMFAGVPYSGTWPFASHVTLLHWRRRL